MREIAQIKKKTSEQKTLVKQGILLAGILVLLAAAAWVNGLLDAHERNAGIAAVPSFRAASEGNVPATAAPAALAAKDGDYFHDFRADRANARAEEIELLDKVIESEADREAVKMALERKVELSAHIEQEFALEKTLIAKGYEDVAAMVRDSIATIAVKKAELDETDAARILEAAMAETQLEADSVKIIPVR